MGLLNQEIVLLDSESESEAERQPKKLRLSATAAPQVPAAIPPMRKPFMDESDGESSENESHSDKNNSARNETIVNRVTCVVDGQEVSVPTPSERFGLDTTPATESPSEHDDSEHDSDASDESSEGSLGSIGLVEIPVRDLVKPDENGEVKTEDIDRLRTVDETRRALKSLGVLPFIEEFLPNLVDSETVYQLLLKLGFRPKNLPPQDSGQNLLALMKLLHMAVYRVNKIRFRLDDFRSVNDVLAALRTARKVLVITGAGISTSLGIPDFRSTEGFYSKMTALGLNDPQEVFDLSVFRADPSIFYSIAHMILPPEGVKAPLHSFIRLLQDRGILLRNYTQNIDNLEANAGILPEKMVQCHGSFANATCMTCGYKTAGVNLYPAMRAGEIAYCPNCTKKRQSLMRKDDVDLEESFGVMKPDITFFGEDLPRRFHDNIKNDLKQCDLLISIGTSLRVQPVSNMVDVVDHNVPQILINKDPLPDCNFDVSFLGFCDDTVSYLCDRLGDEWAIDHPDYSELVGENHDNLMVFGTDEAGVFNVRNKKRDAEDADGPAKLAPEPDLVILEPSFV
ncbi:hypothetical protein OXX79_003472 [Metschnikowia pulcherrima]